MHMGVAERKERHKEDLKREILDAAKLLFTEKGLEATSIRAIAEKIEYSPATIYLYYKDKNEIVHALHSEGFKLLVGHFEVLNHISHPFERLKGMGRAYIQFALQNPDIYKLIFNMEEPLKHVANCFEEWDEGDRAFDILMKTVGECQKLDYFKDFATEQSFVCNLEYHARTLYAANYRPPQPCGCCQGQRSRPRSTHEFHLRNVCCHSGKT
jgi:AcrR family transcriptional regulator